MVARVEFLVSVKQVDRYSADPRKTIEAGKFLLRDGESIALEGVFPERTDTDGDRDNLNTSTAITSISHVTLVSEYGSNRAFRSNRFRSDSKALNGIDETRVNLIGEDGKKVGVVYHVLDNNFKSQMLEGATYLLPEGKSS